MRWMSLISRGSKYRTSAISHMGCRFDDLECLDMHRMVKTPDLPTLPAGRVGIWYSR